MEIKGPDDLRTLKAKLDSAGIPIRGGLSLSDIAEAMKPSSDLWRAFPDQTDPDGVDDIYFNDTIQLCIWYNPEDRKVVRFQIYQNPTFQDDNEAARLVFDWKREGARLGTIEPWKCRWAAAQIERGTHKTVLPNSTKDEILSLLRTRGST